MKRAQVRPFIEASAEDLSEETLLMSNGQNRRGIRYANVRTDTDLSNGIQRYRFSKTKLLAIAARTGGALDGSQAPDSVCWFRPTSAA